MNKAVAAPLGLQRVVLVLAVSTCFAQPAITDLEPRGAQKGRPFTLTVLGRDLSEGTRIESTLPATFTPLALEKGVMGGATFLVEPTGDTLVGVYPIRVVAPNGISNIQLFSIGAFPEITEEESRPGALPNSNDTIETAESIPSTPITVNGKLRGPERDVFRVFAKGGERRVIEVEARRCGSAIDPVIELEDASGKVLAHSEDAPLLGLDARLEVTFPREGYYYVVVHDARFSTQTANFYRLKMGTYLFPTEVFPLGGRRGETVQVSLGAQKITADLRKVPASIRQVFINLPDSPALPVPFAVGEAPEVTAPATAQLAVPVTINARLANPAAIDRYEIQVVPGDLLSFRIEARELGTSKLMAVVAVYDGKGAKLGQAGDEPLSEDLYNVNQSRTAGDPELVVPVPSDGHTLTVTVEDLARRGGPQYPYRLAIRRAAPDFRVVFNTPFVNIPVGGSTAVPLTVQRRGFDGDVHLRLADPPNGLRADGGSVVSVAPMKERWRQRSSPGVLVLTADADLQLSNVELTVEAVADLSDGTQIVRRAEGLGMTVGVTGATLQGSVDRQRAITAPWLGLQLPAAATAPPPATLEVTMLGRKRLEEGDQLQFRWKWTARDTAQVFPKSVNADLVGAADIRVIDAKTDPQDRSAGTFTITTTKLTRPAKYDLYITGRLMIDGQQRDIVSRPIPVEVLEVTSANAAKSDSNR
jgi:hypothetical protein